MAYLSGKKKRVQRAVENAARKMNISVDEAWNFYYGLPQAKQRKLVAEYETQSGKTQETHG